MQNKLQNKSIIEQSAKFKYNKILNIMYNYHIYYIIHNYTTNICSCIYTHTCNDKCTHTQTHTTYSRARARVCIHVYTNVTQY